MQLTLKASPTSKLKNVYKIELNTYFGDADGDRDITITVKENKIKQVIAELIMVKNQFTHGRGGCRMMYDQTNYFGMSYEAYEANGEKHDGFWEWFDTDSSDYPYSGDHEQNYTLRSYEIWYYDTNGVRHAVTVTDTAELVADLNALNVKHKLGDYDMWEDPRRPYHSDKASKEKYEADRARMAAQFAAYREDAIELVNKHSK
jgi:hypothetical protein